MEEKPQMNLESASILPTASPQDGGTVYVGKRPFPCAWVRLVVHGAHVGSEVRLEFATEEITEANLDYFFRCDEVSAKGTHKVLFLPKDPETPAIALKAASILGRAFNALGSERGRTKPSLVFSARTSRRQMEYSVPGTSAERRP
jgi:hypothetical protein